MPVARGAAVLAILLSLAPSLAAQQRAPRVVSNIDALGTIDTSARYLFFLHARILEDQGLPAVSPKFGAYRYHDILQRLAGAGFNVVSEVRPRDARAAVYVERVARQVRALLAAGVPASHITVVGTSKGAYIATLLSHEIETPDIGYVVVAMCDAETVAYLIGQGSDLHGDVLAIRDADDTPDLAGPCEPLFTFSRDIGAHREIVVDVGTGHGIVYAPLDAWVLPVIGWAEGRRR